MNQHISSPPIGRATHFDLPFAALLTLLILGTIKPERLIPGLELFVRVPTFLLVFLLLFWFISPRKILSNNQTYYYLGFVASLLLATYLARNPYFAYLHTKGYLLTIAGYLVSVTYLDTFQKIRKYITISVFLSAPIAVISLTQGGLVRNFPQLADENDFALFINITLPFAFLLAHTAKRMSSKIAYYALISLLLSANVWSLSRAGFLGLIVVLGYCWWLTTHRVRSTLLLTCLLALALAVAPTTYWTEINTIRPALLDPASDRSAADRLYSWNIGWRMFLDHPIIGVGPSNYPIWISDYDRTQEGLRHWGRVSHSIYIDLLSQHGLIGTFFFLAILLQNVRDHRLITTLKRRTYPRSNTQQVTLAEQHELYHTARTIYFLSHATMCALLAYLIGGVFNSVLHYSHFWNLTTIIVVLSNAMRDMMKKAVHLDTQHRTSLPRHRGSRPTTRRSPSLS